MRRGQAGKLQLAPELVDEYNRIKQVTGGEGWLCGVGGVGGVGRGGKEAGRKGEGKEGGWGAGPRGRLGAASGAVVRGGPVAWL